MQCNVVVRYKKSLHRIAMKVPVRGRGIWRNLCNCVQFPFQCLPPFFSLFKAFIGTSSCLITPRDLNFLGVILPRPKIQIHSRLKKTRASPTPIYLWIHAVSGRKHLNSSASHGGHWAWAWWVSWGEVNDKTKGGRDHCCFLPPRLTMRPKKLLAIV